MQIKHLAGLWWKQGLASQCFSKGFSVHGLVRGKKGKLDLGMMVQSKYLHGFSNQSEHRTAFIAAAGFALSNENSDRNICICESACCEVSRSSLLSQSRFSEAVSHLGVYLLKSFS